MNAGWSCWGWANDQSPICKVCWRFICAVLAWLLWTEVWMVLFDCWTSHEELTSYKCHCTVVLIRAKSSSTGTQQYVLTWMVSKSNFHCHRTSDWLHTSIVFGLQNILLLWVSNKKHCTDTVNKCGHGYNSTSAKAHIITCVQELIPLDLEQLAIELKTGLPMSQTKSATAHSAKHDLQRPSTILQYSYLSALPWTVN